MKLKHFLAISLILITSISCNNRQANSLPQIVPVQNSRTSFFCGRDLQGRPTTFAGTPRGRVSVIKWVSEYFRQGGYDPQKRCEEVSSQFQNLYNQDKLKYLSAGVKNNQQIICGMHDYSGECEQLFTLKPGESAGAIIQQLRDIANGRGGGNPVFASGPVDMEKFLQNAPIEP